MAAITAAGPRSCGSAFRPDATSRVTYCSTGTSNTVDMMKNAVQRIPMGAKASAPSARPP